MNNSSHSGLVCFITDPNPDLMIWLCAKTNEIAPSSDLRSLDQPFIHIIFFIFSKKVSSWLEFLIYCLHYKNLKQNFFTQVSFRSSLHHFGSHWNTLRERSPRSEIQIGICMTKQGSQIWIWICAKQTGPLCWYKTSNGIQTGIYLD